MMDPERAYDWGKAIVFWSSLLLAVLPPIETVAGWNFVARRRWIVDVYRILIFLIDRVGALNLRGIMLQIVKTRKNGG